METLIRVKAAGRLVNLEEQAELYLSRKFGHENVKSFGLTQNFSYWTEQRNHTGEYPMEASVLSLECDTRPVVIRRESERLWNCEKVFKWKIHLGLTTPFTLLVNVTIPMIQGSGKNQITLDLNNTTQIIVKSKKTKRHTTPSSLLRRRPNGPWVRMITKECHFTAPTVFSGWFAVNLQNVRGDNPSWLAIEASELQNRTVGLLRKGEDAIAYNITGQYFQTLCQVGSGRP